MKDPKLILICVEDSSLQFSLAKILEREGYQVANLACSLMKDFWGLDKSFDLLVLDNSDIWDEAWIEQLVKIRSRFAKQPILILTAHIPSSATFDCEDFGFCKLIQKPADPAVILENLRELLK